jgi:hypothetical protein
MGQIETEALRGTRPGYMRFAVGIARQDETAFRSIRMGTENVERHGMRHDMAVAQDIVTEAGGGDLLIRR